MAGSGAVPGAGGCKRVVPLRGEGSGTATSIPGKEEKVVVTEWEVGGLEGWGGGLGACGDMESGGAGGGGEPHGGS